MAQQTGQSGGKNPLRITSFWPSTFAEPPMLWEFWFNRFQWGMVAKHSINPRNFYYASTLTAAQVTALKAPAPEDDEFRDYGNNPLRLLGTMNVSLETNGWVTEAKIKVIGGNRPSIIGRDLMPILGLQIVQRTPEEKEMSVQEEHPGPETTSEEDSLDPWQTYYSKQFNNLFHRVGKIKNYKVHADFFETLTPIQQKGRRVPITLQDKVDKEISKLLQQGHIEKLEECSDKYFVSPIVITVKKDGSVKLALESRELNKQVH